MNTDNHPMISTITSAALDLGLTLSFRVCPTTMAREEYESARAAGPGVDVPKRAEDCDLFLYAYEGRGISEVGVNSADGEAFCDLYVDLLDEQWIAYYPTVYYTPAGDCGAPE